jgi:outer membrane protein TolC
MRSLKIKSKVFIFVICLLLCVGAAQAEEEAGHVLTLNEFIKAAAEKDTVFQEILIDELDLRYARELAVPARDFVLSIESQYDFLYQPRHDDTEHAISLSKLFPYYGAVVEVEYNSDLARATRKNTSDLTVSVSQSIAENAFGRNTRLLDEIAGIEVDVARYQIVEAYEDYLAFLIQLYYDWYSSYEDLKTGQLSYEKNLELLDNIKERERNKIALPIDVNKSLLQVADKRDSLVSLEDTYREFTNQIKTAIRHEGDGEIAPQDFPTYADVKIDFVDDFERFWQESRTAWVLRLLEDRSSLQVKRYADELLPSIDIVTTYTLSGSNHDIERASHFFSVGATADWPFPGEKEIANYQVAAIDKKRRKLTTENTYFDLYTNLQNINIRINKERQLITIADERIDLAQKIVDDDLENYSLGRVSLNDLIDEINDLEDNKFNKIFHEVQLKKLMIEWMRLNDILIRKREDIAASP